MDESDESTAVVKIRRNFQDFLTNCPNRRLGFDDTFSETSHGYPDQDKSLQQSEVIVAKAEVTRLQAEIQSLKTLQQQQEIEHKTEIQNVMKEKEKEIAKYAEVKKQLLLVARKESDRKLELTELKQELEKSKELKQSLANVQREKTLLEAELQQLKQESGLALNKMEVEMNDLSKTLQLSQRQLVQQEQLQVTVRTGKENNLRLQQEVENFNSQLLNANLTIRELKVALSRMEEDGKTVQMMKSQLNRLDQLEKENKNLRAESQYLSAVQENTHLLTEENINFHSKLDKSEQRCRELSSFEVLCEDLKKRLEKFESSDPTKSPVYLNQQITELQHEIKQLLKRNGQLQTRNVALEEMHRTCSSELESRKKELASATIRTAELDDLVEHYKRKLHVANNEGEAWKRIVGKYDGHDKLVASLDARAKERIRQLETLLETHQRHNTSLEMHLETDRAQISQLRMKVAMLEQELVRNSQSKPADIPNTNVEDRNLIVSLREKVANLEKKAEELENQKELALAKLEHVDILGGYDCSKTRVVHYRMNPYAMTRNHQKLEFDRLKEENARLSARVKAMEEAGGPVDGLSMIVDEKCPKGMAKELEEVKTQLSSEQLKYQRLKEAFSKTSQELCEINYKVLGYKIDITSSGDYRLMSLYSESPNDFFVFKRSEDGELQLLSNQYSESFQDKVQTYLVVGSSLPAFMSSVTLDLFAHQTIMQQ